MCKVPENSSLKKEIKKLLGLCKQDEKNNNGEKRSYFNDPITEEEMINWEEKSGVKIPESYKEWLRFSGKCRIAGNTATFWGPSEFHSDYVPEGLVVIGEIIGDGEVVCFSENEGIFVRVFEGKTTEINDFAGVLKVIMELMGDKPILSYERYLELSQKIREKKALQEPQKR